MEPEGLTWLDVNFEIYIYYILGSYFQMNASKVLDVELFHYFAIQIDVDIVDLLLIWLILPYVALLLIYFAMHVPQVL